MRVKVVIASKIRDKCIAEVVAEYTGRMRRGLPTEIVEIDTRKGDVAEKLMAASVGCFRVALDAGGRQFDSEGFAGFMSDLKERGMDIAFLIGPAEGLPDAVKDAADVRVSLSKMTMAHRVALAMLAEQLYRAMTIMEHHPYHK